MFDSITAVLPNLGHALPILGPAYQEPDHNRMNVWVVLLQLDKHMPMHLRRKALKERQKPRTFEMIPATGSLMPGQRVNVQVKFMPTEEVR